MFLSSFPLGRPRLAAARGQRPATHFQFRRANSALPFNSWVLHRKNFSRKNRLQAAHDKAGPFCYVLAGAAFPSETERRPPAADSRDGCPTWLCTMLPVLRQMLRVAPLHGGRAAKGGASTAKTAFFAVRLSRLLRQSGRDISPNFAGSLHVTRLFLAFSSFLRAYCL